MKGVIQKQWKRIKLYHKYYRITGLYKYIFQNALKIAGIIILILIAFVLIEKYIIDFDVVFYKMVKKFSWQSVILVFFISETFFGLIPPDLFIIWADHFPHRFLVLTYLALLSYLGGALSFKIGQFLRIIPAIEKFVNNKFKDYFITIRRWGGVIIVISALFPLPYSTISLVAGGMKFPERLYYLLGISRILRFYIYALFLFKVL